MTGGATNTSHTVTTAEFEGPLALLLELVERQKLEVTEISIAAITAGYLQHVRTLSAQSPEQLSEFLQLGARLLYVKSLALLPREAGQNQTEELHQLNLELEEYRRYQQAARELGRLSGRSSWQRQAVSRLEPHELPLPDISLTRLAEAFQMALRRSEPTRPQSILRAHISQDGVMKALRRRLAKGSIELQTILDNAKDRLEIVVTFLAVLELIKLAELRVIQSGQFGAITMEPTNE